MWPLVALVYMWPPVVPVLVQVLAVVVDRAAASLQKVMREAPLGIALSLPSAVEMRASIAHAGPPRPSAAAPVATTGFPWPEPSVNDAADFPLIKDIDDRSLAVHRWSEPPACTPIDPPAWIALLLPLPPLPTASRAPPRPWPNAS